MKIHFSCETLIISYFNFFPGAKFNQFLIKITDEFLNSQFIYRNGTDFFLVVCKLQENPLKWLIVHDKGDFVEWVKGRKEGYRAKQGGKTMTKKKRASTFWSFGSKCF